jgi:nitrate reductase (NAD(P)H)
MMNNWQFRVAINKEATPGVPDGVRLRFEHPTLAGSAAGGWMEVRNSLYRLCSSTHRLMS